MKAAAREADAGVPPRDPVRVPPSLRACSASADGSAGIGAAPLAFEQRFVDRAALPKGVSFGPGVIPTVSIDGDTPTGRAARDEDAAMYDDADDLAGGDHDFDDDAAVAGGAATPVWLPVDATRVQLEDWLGSLRRLPGDGAILARQGVFKQRINGLRMPLPAPRASPLILVLGAKRATDKRRRQLQRFCDMRDALLGEERALQATIADAHATVEATERLLTMAETEEYERFCAYAAAQGAAAQGAPGHAPSPEAAGSASAGAARRAGRDPDAAAGDTYQCSCTVGVCPAQVDG